MTNASKLDESKENKQNIIFTAHELANAIGENYKSVQKILNTLATSGDLTVTEKAVNNRVLKGYKLSIEDIKSIKDKFLAKKHLQTSELSPYITNAYNALNNSTSREFFEKNTNAENVKIYEEVINENSALKSEVEKLKKDIQEKINSNVKLDADLSIARSELKYIEDKSKTMESAFSQKKLEVEKLQRDVKNRNIALIVLGGVLLAFLSIVLTAIFIK